MCVQFATLNPFDSRVPSAGLHVLKKPRNAHSGFSEPFSAQVPKSLIIQSLDP